jgi:hypothetical protein
VDAEDPPPTQARRVVDAEASVDRVEGLEVQDPVCGQVVGIGPDGLGMSRVSRRGPVLGMGEPSAVTR